MAFPSTHHHLLTESHGSSAHDRHPLVHVSPIVIRLSILLTIVILDRHPRDQNLFRTRSFVDLVHAWKRSDELALG